MTMSIPLAPAQIRGLRRLNAGLPIIWTRDRLLDYRGDSSTAKGLAERGLVGEPSMGTMKYSGECLTPAQERVVRRLGLGLAIDHGIRGHERPSFTLTCRALVRKGIIDEHSCLTKAGNKWLEEHP